MIVKIRIYSEKPISPSRRNFQLDLHLVNGEQMAPWLFGRTDILNDSLLVSLTADIA
jgi:hypothetical protein